MARETTGYTGTATVTADLTEATKLNKQAGIQLQQAQNIAGVGKLVGAVAQTAVNEYQNASEEDKRQKNITDSGASYQESITNLQDMASTGTAQETNAFVEKQLEQARQDFTDGLISEGTYKGKVAVFQNALSGSSTKAQEETDAKVSSVMVGDMKASILTGTNIKEYDELTTAEVAGMSRVGYRNAKIEALYAAGSDVALMSESPQALKEAQAWHNEQVNSLKTDPIYRGKNADQEFTKREQGYKASVKAKTDILNTKLDQKRAQADIAYNMTPNEYDSNLADRYGTNTKEFTIGQNKYQDSYKGHMVDVNYNTTYSVNEPHPIVPKEAKDTWQKSVTSNAAQYFLQGNGSEFAKTINYNPGFTEEAGQMMYGAYTQAQDSGQLTAVVNNIVSIAHAPNGATALSQSMKPEQLNEIIAVSALASSVYTGDEKGLEKAKTLYAQQKLNPVQQAWDKDLQQDVYENAVELGSTGNLYLSTMQTLNNINPQVASNSEKTVRAFYENQQDKVSTMFGTKATNTTMGINTIKENALNAELTMNNFISSAENATGYTVDRVDFLPNGMTFVTDGFGLGTLINSNHIIAKDNASVVRIAGEKEQGLPVGDIVGSSFVNIVDGLLTSGGTLADKFGTYLGEQNEETIASFEAGIDNIIGLFDAPEGGYVEPINNTLKDSARVAYEYAKEKRIKVVEKAKEAKRIIQTRNQPRNVKNNNPGNIKYNPANKWQGSTGLTDEGGTTAVGSFEKFESPEYGIRAMKKVIQANINATNTFETYVNRYASEPKEQEAFRNSGKLNKNLENYAKIIAKSQGKSVKDPIPKNIDMKKWIKATIIAEGGSDSLKYFTDDVINSGLKLK